MPEQDTTNNPQPLNLESLSLVSQDQAASQPKSNVHKMLEAFLQKQKAEIADPAYRPTPPEAQDVQAQPYDGPNPGGLVSFAYKSGDARVAPVPTSENSVAGGNGMPESGFSSKPRADAKVNEGK